MPAYESKIQDDIDWYEQHGMIVDVAAGNSQLTWEFQDMVAAEQLSWLKNEKTLEEVLQYADQNREFSTY